MKTFIVPLNKPLIKRIRKIWADTYKSKKHVLHSTGANNEGDRFMALDVPKKQLLYAKNKSNASSCLIIDLKHLEKCSIKKEYGHINAGELNSRKLYHFIKTIILKLVFKNGSGSLSIPLFDAQNETHNNIDKLEADVREWEDMVTKMLPVKEREIA